LFDIYTIIFLALAVFIFLRLRSVLGQRTGRERPPYDPYSSARDAMRPSPGDKVVALPGRAPDTQKSSSEPAEPVDRWKGIAEPGSALAAGLDAIVREDRTFDPKHFVTGGRAAYDMIVTAYAAGDRRQLKNLLGREVYEGFDAAIKKYPGIKVLASQPANYNQAQGLKVMENYLQAYPGQIDAVYAHNDQMAFGALIAIENAKIPAGKIKVYGSNGSTDAIKKIMDGEMEASPLYRHGADEAVQTVLALIDNKPVQKMVLLAPEMIARDNAKDYYQPGTFMASPRNR